MTLVDVIILHYFWTNFPTGEVTLPECSTLRVSFVFCRRGRSILALRRLLQRRRHLPGGDPASPQVPRPVETLLGQRQPRQLGDVLRACGGAPRLPEGAGPRQQHPDLRRAARSPARGPEERTGHIWNHAVNWHSGRGYLSRLYLHEEEADPVQLVEETLL